MSDVVVPIDAAVALAHAEVQAIAEDHHVDLLHIKGPALDESLRRPWPDLIAGAPRTSMDADVLVRPAHVVRLHRALASSGWRCMYDFPDGSAFEHAATWGRCDLASLDVHRLFPGIEIDADVAFDLLWNDRGNAFIAGLPCPVPSLPAQRLIVLVHAARGRGARDIADRERAWFSLDEEARSEVDALSDRLRARVALRAGTGRLESVRGERSYPLWRHLTTGNTSLPGLWWARVRSAPTVRGGARIGIRMILPNRNRMTTRLGRPPTRAEVLTAYRSRLRFGMRTLTRWAKTHSRGSP